MRMQATVCVVTWHAVVRDVVEDMRATASPDIDHVDFSPRRLWPQPLMDRCILGSCWRHMQAPRAHDTAGHGKPGEPDECWNGGHGLSVCDRAERHSVGRSQRSLSLVLSGKRAAVCHALVLTSTVGGKTMHHKSVVKFLELPRA